jgi:hypothetical protein
MSSFSKIHLGIALTTIIAGCNDPATDEGDEGKGPCFLVPGECNDTGETGSEMGETGETGGGSPEALGVGECVFNVGEGKIGKQYNCFGELHTSLDLAISGLFPTCEDLFDDDGWCSADFYFDYEPQVVACCGDYDIALKSNFQEFCSYDLYEQVCRSLAHQLAYQVEQGHFEIYGDKGAELQQYVADNQGPCFDAFFANNTATLPFVETHWALPKKFGLLGDIVFHIEPNTRIDGVNNPLSGDEWLTCENAAYNNDTFFGNTGNQQPQGGIVAGVDLADPAHAELSGPVLFGGAVSASVEFGTSCSALGCPRAEFSYDAEDTAFGLEQLTLIGGPFEISNGTYSLTADRVQVRLYAPAAGVQVSEPDGGVLGYEIPPGEAVFFVAGIAGDTANRFMASNATSIWVIREERENHDLWQIDAFVLAYEDGNHERWTAMIDASSWR